MLPITGYPDRYSGRARRIHCLQGELGRERALRCEAGARHQRRPQPRGSGHAGRAGGGRLRRNVSLSGAAHPQRLPGARFGHCPSRHPAELHRLRDDLAHPSPPRSPAGPGLPNRRLDGRGLQPGNRRRGFGGRDLERRKRERHRAYRQGASGPGLVPGLPELRRRRGRSARRPAGDRTCADGRRLRLRHRCRGARGKRGRERRPGVRGARRRSARGALQRQAGSAADLRSRDGFRYRRTGPRTPRVPLPPAKGWWPHGTFPGRRRPRASWTPVRTRCTERPSTCPRAP